MTAWHKYGRAVNGPKTPTTQIDISIHCKQTSAGRANVKGGLGRRGFGQLLSHSAYLFRLQRETFRDHKPEHISAACGDIFERWIPGTAKMSKPQVAARLNVCCPLCGFFDSDTYILLLHVEQMHPEHAPALSKAAEKSTSQMSEEQFTLNALELITEGQAPEYVMCDVEGCGEPVLLAEIDSHVDLHYAERLALKDVFSDTEDQTGPESTGANTKRPRAASSDREGDGRSIISSINETSSGSKKRKPRPQSSSLSPLAMALTRTAKPAPARKKPGRLGVSTRNFVKLFLKNLTDPQKSDLGPYADEKEMPKRLLQACAEGGKVITKTKLGPDGKLVRVQSIENETEGLISTMSLLCDADPGVAQAWLCHPNVKHVGKQGIGREVFCGYRNIQMLISYIQKQYPEGSHPFTGRIPTILKIQDWIEEGWDRGINSTGRIETGGIKNTRRFIGTAEAQTLFVRHGIPCKPVPFHKSNELNTQLNLLNYVEEYFKSAVPDGTKRAKVYVTPRPPIYFQQPGHSMTIVGIERTRDGWQNLLVFDPVFEPSGAIKELEGSNRINSSINAAAVLKAYRRGMGHLRRFEEFEILTQVTQFEIVNAMLTRVDSRDPPACRSQPRTYPDQGLHPSTDIQDPGILQAHPQAALRLITQVLVTKLHPVRFP